MSLFNCVRQQQFQQETKEYFKKFIVGQLDMKTIQI